MINRNRTTTALCSCLAGACVKTDSLRTKILDFGGFDSSRILILRGGIPMSIGDFPESLSQVILVGTFFVGRLGAARIRSL